MEAKDITAEAIEQAIEAARSKNPPVFTEQRSKRFRPVAIRVCYAWLTAQSFRKTEGLSAYALKHRVEEWWGNFFSEAEFVTALELHGGTNRGKYVSNKLVMPHPQRAEGLAYESGLYRQGLTPPDRSKLCEGQDFDRCQGLDSCYTYIETDHGLARFC